MKFTSKASSNRVWFIIAILIVGIAFILGGAVNNMANGASASGTSIPIEKGGTNATDRAGALNNLLPDRTNNNGKVLGLNSSGVPSWLPSSRNDSFTATSSYSFKGTKYVELGYTGESSSGWPTNSYKRFYHGEGVSFGSNNIIVLKITVNGWPAAQYSEFLLILNLRQTTDLEHLTIAQTVSTGVRAPETGTPSYSYNPVQFPEILIAGDAVSFDIYIQKPASGRGITVELVGYDEVSPADTLLNEEPVAATSLSRAIPTEYSSADPDGNYAEYEINTGGTWIDGKPIYKRTVTTTGPASAGSGVYRGTDITLVDTIVKSETIVKLADGTTFTVPAVYNSGGRNRINVSPLKANDNVIRIDIVVPNSNSPALDATLYVTLYYTKL
jgi:hypothetical protein